MKKEKKKDKNKIACNRNCFHCKYDDCIVDTISARESIDQLARDLKYENYGKELQRAYKRSKLKRSKKAMRY